jgi:hypothetical protein
MMQLILMQLIIKDNLDSNELKYFKKLAKDLLGINRQKYLGLERSGDFFSIKE